MTREELGGKLGQDELVIVEMVRTAATICGAGHRVAQEGCAGLSLSDGSAPPVLYIDYFQPTPISDTAPAGWMGDQSLPQDGPLCCRRLLRHHTYAYITDQALAPRLQRSCWVLPDQFWRFCSTSDTATVSVTSQASQAGPRSFVCITGPAHCATLIKFTNVHQ